jgi:hypothetical protein
MGFELARGHEQDLLAHTLGGTEHRVAAHHGAAAAEGPTLSGSASVSP